MRLETLWVNSLESRNELQSNLERARIVKATEGSNYTTEMRHKATKMVGNTFETIAGAGLAATTAAYNLASYLVPGSSSVTEKKAE